MREIFFLRCFRKDRSSAAAVEFALLAPILIGMFLSTVELTLVIRLQEKLNLAAGQLSQLVAAQPTVTEGTADGPGGTLGDMCTGVSYTLLPFNPANLSGWIESSTVTTANAVAQDWGNDELCPATKKGANAAAEQSILTSIAQTPFSMFTQDGKAASASDPNVAGFSAISLQLTYVYNNIIPFIFGPSITLKAIAVARPRSNSTITCTVGTGTNPPSCGVFQ